VTALLLLSGLVLLVAGGELLVRGAVRIALVFGVSPLIIGLTVVAFGTSAPELAVSLFAAVRGSADVAVGNVVGSNIFNVLFILGISAALVPFVVSHQLIRLDVPIMILVSLLFFVFASSGVIVRGEGIVLVAGLLGYIGIQIRIARRSPIAPPEQTEHEGHWIRDIVYIIIGLALLVLGSRWLVNGAITLARQLGVTELVIGLTIVASGTSLPEVATSIIAGLRGQRDIAVGNVIGSNIFNILAVIGVTAVAAPHGVPVSAAAFAVDIPVMIAVAALCLPIFISGFTVSRWEGLLFIAYFCPYITYLVLDSSQHGDLSDYSRLVLNIVIPLSLLTILGSLLRRYILRRRA
jgi:cation:H+ antiporter